MELRASGRSPFNSTSAPWPSMRQKMPSNWPPAPFAKRASIRSRWPTQALVRPRPQARPRTVTSTAPDRPVPGAWGVGAVAGRRRRTAGLLRPGHAGVEGRGAGRVGGSHLTGRLRRLQEEPDRAASWPAQHQCTDDGGGHRRVCHRPVARGGDGDGAVCVELAATTPVAAPTTVAAPQPYAPRAEYGQGGIRPRHEDRYAGGHRRKSFLQDLFD